VLLMNEGQIEQVGTPLDIYQNPRTLFSATFIGTNNFLPGTIVETAGHEYMVKLEGLNIVFRTTSNHPDLSAGMPVWACIRADDIDIIAPDDAPDRENVIQVAVTHASLTGSIVIIEGKLDSQTLRIHVGGGRRLDLLNAAGSTITCTLSHIALVPRETNITETLSSLKQPV
jgi:ABC-type Fe3+/spermidine/putrescine transport system ATPase subunit